MEQPFEPTYDRKGLRPRYSESIPPGKIREKLLELFGMADIPEQVDYTVGHSRVEGGIRLTDLTYANSHAETVPAILIETAGRPGRTPAGRGLLTGHGRVGRAHGPRTVLQRRSE